MTFALSATWDGLPSTGSGEVESVHGPREAESTLLRIALQALDRREGDPQTPEAGSGCLFAPSPLAPTHIGGLETSMTEIEILSFSSGESVSRN